jgi:pSer/pThr/pTyr-binding forkhead associated (FHA) protein
MPKLIISEQGRHEEWIHECGEVAVSIGRHDSNVVTLPGRGVSRQHAQILKEGDDFFLIDMESGNGTFLNGNRIKATEKHLLRNKDNIAIDTFELKFYTTDELLEKSYNEEITESDILEVKLLKKVIGALDKETVPSLEVLNGTAEGTKVHLSDDMQELVIGRDPDADVSINEYVISRKHAKIIKRWGGIAIRDLESKNGTFVNNRRVVEEYLHDGDRIALGTIVMMFRNPQEINFAHFAEKIPPKHKPAKVAPESIPAAEGIPEEAQPEEGEEEAYEPQPEERFEELEEARYAPVQGYPAAKQKLWKRFTPIEIGMVGLGALIFIFALITLVNLMFA